MIFPLKKYIYEIPEGKHLGAFGSIRKFDIHTGIDLYCELQDDVIAMESGIVVDIIPFTGSISNTPWWNNTYAIIVKGESGYILYGEIAPKVKKNQFIREGQIIGNVITVLKKDKGLPMNMLHLELYSKYELDAVVWELNKHRPLGLEDPTELLKRVRNHE